MSILLTSEQGARKGQIQKVVLARCGYAVEQQIVALLAMVDGIAVAEIGPGDIVDLARRGTSASIWPKVLDAPGTLLLVPTGFSGELFEDLRSGAGSRAYEAEDYLEIIASSIALPAILPSRTAVLLDIACFKMSPMATLRVLGGMTGLSLFGRLAEMAEQACSETAAESQQLMQSEFAAMVTTDVFRQDFEPDFLWQIEATFRRIRQAFLQEMFSVNLLDRYKTNHVVKSLHSDSQFGPFLIAGHDRATGLPVQRYFRNSFFIHPNDEDTGVAKLVFAALPIWGETRLQGGILPHDVRASDCAIEVLLVDSITGMRRPLGDRVLLQGGLGQPVHWTCHADPGFYTLLIASSAQPTGSSIFYGGQHLDGLTLSQIGEPRHADQPS